MQKGGAASKLLGVNLGSGWHIKEEIHPLQGQTGGHFSHRYLVENEDGRKGFMKAFDLSSAFEDPSADTIALVRHLTACYEHERDILNHCKNQHLSKVAVPIEHGNIQLPNLPLMEGRAFYLIFELADGDLRVQVDLTNRFDALWSLRALKDVCLGLWQIHRQLIAHQDLKPSNILSFRQAQEFRVADLGRSSRRGVNAPHDSVKFPGDNTYAPPEFRYGYIDPDFITRRIGGDLFMLGNIAAFLFCGINVMTHMLTHLDPQYHPGTWHGSYDQVLPYLNSAFTQTLGEIAGDIDELVRPHVVRLIRELSNPDIRRRGHPRGLAKGDQYSLERYVSELDLIFARARLEASHRKRSA